MLNFCPVHQYFKLGICPKKLFYIFVFQIKNFRFENHS